MIQVIATAGRNLVLVRANLSEIVEQDVNARVMTPEAMDRLTETIRTEERLEQLPFGVLRCKVPLPDPMVFPFDLDAKVELISGHHRTRAARAAGIQELLVLADTRDLSRSAVVAKQLAHNAIAGKDDPQTLSRLYAEMDEVEHLLESFVRPEEFDGVKQLEPAGIVDISLAIPFKHMSLVFLPNTEAAIERIADVVARVPKDTDMIGVCSAELYERFREVARQTGKTENIRSLGTILARMCELTEKQLAADAPAAPVPENNSAPKVEQPVARARRQPRKPAAA